MTFFRNKRILCNSNRCINLYKYLEYIWNGKYFFDVTNFFLEIFLLGIWTPIMFLAIIMELYYDVIIRKVTKKERELKKEAKILIYKVIEILQSQEISSLKQYVSPDLYLKLEQNFYNKQNIQHYRIEKIKPIKEKEIWENDTELV